MRNKAVPLLAGILLAATPAYAVGGISSIDMGFISSLLSKALEQFTKLFGIQSVRVVVALGLLGWIFYKLLDTTLGKINQFAEARTPISIAISILAVLGVFKAVKIETIDRLTIFFAILAGLLLVFHLFMKFKNYFFGGANHRKVVKDEKRESNDRNDESKVLDYFLKLENMMKQSINNIRNAHHESAESEKLAKEQIAALKKELEELHEVYNIAARGRGGV